METRLGSVSERQQADGIDEEEEVGEETGESKVSSILHDVIEPDAFDEQ